MTLELNSEKGQNDHRFLTSTFKMQQSFQKAEILPFKQAGKLVPVQLPRLGWAAPAHLCMAAPHAHHRACPLEAGAGAAVSQTRERQHPSNIAAW